MALRSFTDIVPLQRGDALGERYVLDAKLGQGSMAEVWRAWDEQQEVWVAIKIVAEILALSERARQRFAREVAAIGRIDHANVVHLFDHGVVEDERPFLVMEYVPGETLTSRLEHTPRLDVPLALSLSRQLLAGLGAAHAQGVIHRDLKPANILLAGDDASTTSLGPAAHPHPGCSLGTVKILDFGVARLIDFTTDDGQPRLTATGTMLGSPRYMPAEVARGASDVDARADLFATSAVVYDALTGHPPFGGGPIGVVIRAILEHDFPRLADERPGLPPALVAVLERGMAFAPDDRYGSAEEMLAALDDL